MDKIPNVLEIKGIKQEVRVIIDKRRIPHIFAENTHDLFMAQGYIVARDRLWQMEMQTHLAAGRLAEIVGPAAVDIDRYHRRLGLVFGAERALEFAGEHEETREALKAYVQGINAYIDSLNSWSLPLEYKILDYKPEKWTELKTILMLKLMSETLTAGSTEPEMTLAFDALGQEVMEDLFPLQPPLPEPIIPEGTTWDFEPVELPEPPVKIIPTEVSPGMTNEEVSALGSNNWAVSGKKTKNGAPILCNDPHLGLTLPSIWYELQLNAPGINVYGVSIPGTPCVVIGFNEDIAWGLTNAGSDVFDWYRIKFKDETKLEYFHAGKWEDVAVRREVIKIRGSQDMIDDVRYTHHGPIVYTESESGRFSNIPVDAALRWTAHDRSDELLTFLKLNRARDYADYVDALSHFECPAQNFVFASSSGDIAIWHNGKFPLRWLKQGRYLSDGSDPVYEWRAWIPHEHVPHVINPERGFVSSANQEPADPSYPYYLDWSYGSFSRANRINEVLSSGKALTPQDMIDLQNDTLNPIAQMGLPILLPLVQGDNLRETEQLVFDALNDWDCRYELDRIEPTIFESWWQVLEELIWKDDLKSGDTQLKFPSSDVTLKKILSEPSCVYFDNSVTETIETLKDLAIESFKIAVIRLNEEYGPVGRGWEWGNAKKTDIFHLARIPGLGRENLRTPGSSGTVRATANTWGPSWCLVVTWDQQVCAWGIYPGGQSGNPGSRFYDNMVDDWREGRVQKLHFLYNPGIEAEHFAGSVLFRGAR
ncbi:MAG: penicillin acylase family protein [Candidatus Aminicenantes bacterium]|nr:penicillin acylase family protein [Candidatus Aminicenantes bacterium]